MTQFSEDDKSTNTGGSTDIATSKQQASASNGRSSGAGIARKETRRLVYFKAAFGLILVAFAVGVSLWVYFRVSETEQTTFEAEYNDRVDKILDSFQSNLAKEAQSIDSLGIQLTSKGLSFST